MRTAIVIPARYASSRFPGKPLAPLRVPEGGRAPLVELTWRAAMAVPDIDAVCVATDDARIAEAARSFGADVAMTAPSCRNGTERCAEALATGALDADLVVNLQGDAPLTPPWFVTALIQAMARDTAVQVATPVLRCTPDSFAHFRSDRQAGRVGGTTAVMAANGDALYFSKEVLPYVPPGRLPDPIPVFHHVGVYAYRPAALAAYAAWAPGPLERLEGLEQLRFLENGTPIRCVEVDARGRTFWEVNHPADIARVEDAMRRRTDA